MPAPGESAPWIIRSTLGVEVRGGTVHVFMPPLRRGEDYLALLSAIEHAARETATPLVIEGYTPPSDPRLREFKLTPDPGVLEVNVHPASSWPELCGITETLYDAARRVGLSTEKFQLDGRHTGTGGGNHVVVGGRTPLDSPFLRRPDLLRSIIAHWQNHPALSYLFSGMFVGPTSQAPRFDEGRPDALYEMEIAFGHTPAGRSATKSPAFCPTPKTPNPPPGSPTASSATCSPTSPATPTAPKSASTSSTPPTAPPAAWASSNSAASKCPPTRAWPSRKPSSSARSSPGSGKPPTTATSPAGAPRCTTASACPTTSKKTSPGSSPTFNDHGYPFDPAWYDAFFEFRYPRLGTVESAGLTLELRQAIEPWLTLGEESTSGGQSRYVDSSVERMQVKATGLLPGRHLITVNGREVPLTPTQRTGEYIAGIKYRAWQPWSCLHPTIPVHAPLTVEILDLQTKTILTGGTYHVVHPGGRAHETFPINALEAESRRAGRFNKHRAGKGRDYLYERDVRSQEHPITLDLRRPAAGPKVQK